MRKRERVTLQQRMNTQIDITSSDILESMELHATIKVPRRVLYIVRVRLWLATKLIQLAGIVGGFAICITDADAEADDAS